MDTKSVQGKNVVAIYNLLILTNNEVRSVATSFSLREVLSQCFNMLDTAEAHGFKVRQEETSENSSKIYEYSVSKDGRYIASQVITCTSIDL